MIKLKNILQSNIFIIIIIFITFIYFVINYIILSNYQFINRTHFEGIIYDYNIDGNLLKIYFNDKENIIANYYINNIDEKKYFEDNILYGSLIKINGVINIPSNNTIPNTFNYKNYLFNKGIYYIVDVNDIKIDNNNISIFYKIKNYLNNRINKNLNKEYLKTFILGDKRLIDSDIYQSFQELGITHLFCISGMHISLFTIILFYLLKRFKLSNNIIYFIIIIILGFYGFLVAFSPSIKRAYILFVLLCLNKIFKLKISNIKLLLYTLIINIFIDPLIIFDIGFLYSYIITFGLIIFSKYISCGSYINRLFKVSLIAYIVSLPITINNNYYINLLSPINNIFLVPYITFVIYPLSLVTFIIPSLSFIYSFFLNILIIISSFLLNFNIFNITVPKMNILFILLYYLILLLIYFFDNKKLFLINIILLLLNIYIPYIDNSYYVYFLDVGQGDLELIINRNKSDITLIDIGGKVKYNVEEWKIKNKEYNYLNYIITFFRSMGITKIDNFIISHGDFDHMGESINLVENFKVEKVIFNCDEFNELESELIKVLDKKKIPYYSCIKELNVDNNKLYFLQTKEYDNENDNSNVIYTEIDDYKFMFMGDAGVEKERDILEKYNISNIDVLKVGHHGSKTSSSKSFINEMNPKYSIISVGKNNRYGHPNREVLDILDNSKIYRTDKQGSIMFRIKNNKLKIDTCTP